MTTDNEKTFSHLSNTGLEITIAEYENKLKEAEKTAAHYRSILFDLKKVREQRERKDA